MLPLAWLPSFRPWEMILVAIVCLLVFGNRLPSIMRSLGKLKNGSGPRPPSFP